MINIGLIGEDPNDTSSIKHLLSKRYNNIKFTPLAKGIRGHQLDNPKLNKVLEVELKHSYYNFLIFIRDLDAFGTETAKVEVKEKWFQKHNKAFGNNNILLLNIWELEALILADIETFNKLYNVAYKFKGNVMLQKEPKEILIKLTQKFNKKYKESHCPEIFKELNIETIEKNCKFFKEFIAEFEAKL